MFGKRIALALTAALGIAFGANAQTLDTTAAVVNNDIICLLYTSPSPRD